MPAEAPAGPVAADCTLDAAGTHLYPGARGTIRDGLPESPGPQPLRCLAVFSDGAFTFGTLSRSGPQEWTLALDPHRTAAGTAIPAKRWRLAVRTEGGATLYRVQARL